MNYMVNLMPISYSELIENSIQEEYKKVNQDQDYYYLYKHYKMDTEKLTLGVFNDSQLKYQYPLNFNDPYDCLCTIKLDFKSFKKTDFENFIRSKVTAKAWLENKNKYLKIVESKFNSQEYIEEFRKYIAVTCFNNAPLNILMWSHYADHHRGFMLEFRYKKIENNYRNLPMPVIYSNEYPRLTVPWNLKYIRQDKELLAEFVVKQLLIKSEIWRYEKEFRVSTTNSLFKKYDPNTLASVILGSQISDSDEKAIISAIEKYNKVNNTDVKIYKTSPVDNKFELTVNSHPRLCN